MSIQSEYSRLVSKYLEEGMTGSEKVIFEEQLVSDPLLKAEFDHQNEIISGLRQYRKAQLKAKLDNVTITPGLLGVISQSGTLKTLSYVVTSILVGTGTYIYFAGKSTSEFHMTNIEAKLEVDHRLSLAKFTTPLDYRYDKSTQPAEWVEIKKAPSASKPKNTTEPANAIAFDVPQVAQDLPEEDAGQPDQILEKVVTQRTPFAAPVKLDRVDIENVTTNRYKFHYRMENNKLFLYGKFEASPYEIIEINSFQSKKLFFYYNGNYYRLRQDAIDISPLIQIDDQAVVAELDIIKSKNQ